MRTEEEIKEIIKKRYAMFKEAINAEIGDWMNENINYKNKKLEFDSRFIQRSHIYFGERQIIITLNLSESIYNTDKFINDLLKDADNE